MQPAQPQPLAAGALLHVHRPQCARRSLSRRYRHSHQRPSVWHRCLHAQLHESRKQADSGRAHGPRPTQARAAALSRLMPTAGALACKLPPLAGVHAYGRSLLGLQQAAVPAYLLGVHTQHLAGLHGAHQPDHPVPNTCCHGAAVGLLECGEACTRLKHQPQQQRQQASCTSRVTESVSSSPAAGFNRAAQKAEAEACSASSPGDQHSSIYQCSPVQARLAV